MNSVSKGILSKTADSKRTVDEPEKGRYQDEKAPE